MFGMLTMDSEVQRWLLYLLAAMLQFLPGAGRVHGLEARACCVLTHSVQGS